MTACKKTPGLDSCNTFSVKTLGKMTDDIPLYMECTKGHSIIDVLYRERHLPKNT